MLYSSPLTPFHLQRPRNVVPDFPLRAGERVYVSVCVCVCVCVCVGGGDVSVRTPQRTQCASIR
jgi:hypothetical protein